MNSNDIDALFGLLVSVIISYYFLQALGASSLFSNIAAWLEQAILTPIENLITFIVGFIMDPIDDVLALLVAAGIWKYNEGKGE